jgi:hypothetical protein
MEIKITNIGGEIAKAIHLRSIYNCAEDSMKKAVNYYRYINSRLKGEPEHAELLKYYKQKAVDECEQYLKIEADSPFKNPTSTALANNFISKHKTKQQ